MEALSLLGRGAFSIDDAEYHSLAARALLVLGRGSEARLATALQHIVSGGPGRGDHAIETGLKELASRRLSEAAVIGANTLTNPLKAAEVALEALLTDPSCISKSGVALRLNVGSLLDKRSRNWVDTRGTPWLAWVLEGDDRSQTVPWAQVREMVNAARGLLLLGRREEAANLLRCIDTRFADELTRRTIGMLERSWREDR